MEEEEKPLRVGIRVLVRVDIPVWSFFGMWAERERLKDESDVNLH